MNDQDADDLRCYVEEGSQPAFTRLLERHIHLVYSVARRHVSSSALAEDVAQTVFIELARTARSIKSGTPLIAWLHVVSRRIALNTARTELRRQARARGLDPEFLREPPAGRDRIQSGPGPARPRFLGFTRLLSTGSATGEARGAAADGTHAAVLSRKRIARPQRVVCSGQRATEHIGAFPHRGKESPKTPRAPHAALAKPDDCDCSPRRFVMASLKDSFVRRLRPLPASRTVLGLLSVAVATILAAAALRWQGAGPGSLPHLLTPALIAFAVALAVIALLFHLRRAAPRGRWVTVCAWTRRVEWQGRWLTFEEFLAQRFNVRCTHGICEEELARMKKAAGIGEGR